MTNPFRDFIETIEIDGVFIPLTRTCVDEAIADWKQKHNPPRPVRKRTRLTDDELEVLAKDPLFAWGCVDFGDWS